MYKRSGKKASGESGHRYQYLACYTTVYTYYSVGHKYLRIWVYIFICIYEIAATCTVINALGCLTVSVYFWSNEQVGGHGVAFDIPTQYNCCVYMMLKSPGA